MTKNKLAAAFAEALDLPEEVVSSLPRLTLVGDGRLTAENHQGIIVYTPGRIVFATVLGEVELLGRELTLSYLARQELAVTGEIWAVSYQNGLPTEQERKRKPPNAAPEEAKKP